MYFCHANKNNGNFFLRTRCWHFYGFYVFSHQEKIFYVEIFFTFFAHSFFSFLVFTDFRMSSSSDSSEAFSDRADISLEDIVSYLMN